MYVIKYFVENEEFLDDSIEIPFIVESMFADRLREGVVEFDKFIEKEVKETD